MNILVLYAHPVETSFNAALHRLIVERLSAAGHSVDDCDLYAEEFDPRMTRAEQSGLSRPAQRRRTCRRLCRAPACRRRAGVVVSGLELRLSGDPERLFRPRVPARRVVQAGRRKGAAILAEHQEGRRPSPLMAAAGFAPFSIGDPPRKIVNRVLRATIKPGAPVSYLAHYSMNLSTEKTRKTFMTKVAAKMDAF